MEGAKYDGDKPKWNLLPLKAVGEVVKVLTFGSRKYEDWNWIKVPDARNRYFAAAFRHLEQYQSGEKLDSESGITHLAHAACNLIFLIWFDFQDKDKEDENSTS